jgi:integrase
MPLLGFLQKPKNLSRRLVEQRERSDNPAKALRTPKVTRKPGRSLTPDEVRAGHRYGLAVHLGLMGLRRGELPGLMWDDFDEEAGTLTIRRQIQKVSGTWTPVEPKDDRSGSLGAPGYGLGNGFAVPPRHGAAGHAKSNKYAML